MSITVLNPHTPEEAFPPVDQALKSPDGLLAAGGSLHAMRLLNAYRNGIFPWYNPGEPILWWSPDPRLVLFPDQLCVSRSLRKILKKNAMTITYDQDFSAVIKNCAAPRQDQMGTWISFEMQQAYIRLHQLGYAHSVEAWFDDELVGGLYGVAIGQVFFGESMFFKKSNASKIAFCHLVEQLQQWNYQLIDCQVETQHLYSLGAEKLNRSRFIELLKHYCPIPPHRDAWQ